MHACIQKRMNMFIFFCMHACMHVGVPVAPVSPAYSLMSKDFAKLRTLAQILEPAAIYAAAGPKSGDDQGVA